MADRKECNRELIGRYPFLLPRNRFTGAVAEDYDYSFTELDDMPDGWRMAFGEQLCSDIMDALTKDGAENTYRIAQIKEKYGRLCWYDFGATKAVHDAIRKYEELSKKICAECGKPATRVTTGWICPYCDSCVPENHSGGKLPSVPITEFYS